MLSSFTLISLVGVMLGVLVLVVVMAVYAGMERQVKGRILGFTPHILMSGRADGFSEKPPMADWRAAAERAKALPRVRAATAFVADNVIIDVENWQRPVMFQGIDTSDPAQVEGIAAMLDRENHPDASADLGLDDRVVVSSTLADQLALGVGSIVRLYSTRNFEEVMRVYKATERPPLREAHTEVWTGATGVIAKGWKDEGDAKVIAIATLADAYEKLDLLREENIRDPEVGLLNELLKSLEAGERDDGKGVYRFTGENKQAVDAAVKALETTDVEEMDAEALKSLRQFVLPKEAEVIGVYRASQMAVTPDLFVPLPLAQDLAGLEEDTVQGIALRLDDAYAAEQVAAEARGILGPEWALMTWGDQYQAFFALINQQRVMMYFALSFIVLVSAFSMMAVMFTVTIQKRREIGVMKALGAAPGQIVRVFLYQGMLLGVLGAALGIVLGRVVIRFRGEIQEVFRALRFDPFSAGFTGFDVLPAHHNVTEQILIGVMAFVLCSLAALVPAFFAARSDAAKSLRNL
jgi:lipoprotein-releasing system permease protein